MVRCPDEVPGTSSDLLREPGRPVTILTATSGDTGSAVAHAFWRREGVRVVVLYPKGRISDLHLADPHAAVAYGVLRDHLQTGETGIFLGTAHPAKFLPVYERMGIEVTVPETLAALRGRPIVAREMPADFEALRKALESA